MKPRTFLGIVLLSIAALIAFLPIGPVLAEAIPASSLGPQPNTWFVASDGYDAWSGVLPSPNMKRTDGPFATLQRARDELRRRRAANGLSDGATVIVRQGVYSLAEPLTILPEDSGTKLGPITYTAAPGEEVILKGSRPVSG